MDLDGPLQQVKGVGDTLAAKLGELGVNNIYELLNYFPRRYDDYSNIQPVNSIKPGMVSIKAKIKSVKGRYVRRGMHVTEAVASDESGSVRIVWFNQPYRESNTKRNANYYISGNFELNHQRLSIINPSAELVSDFPLNTARIVPVYGVKKGITVLQIRRIVKQLMPLVETLPETLPRWMLDKYQLLPKSQAIAAIHFPDSGEALDQAKARLGFEEVLELNLASLLNRQDFNSSKTLKISFNEKLAQKFVANLPFTLTDDQKKAVWQIYLDMQKNQPMNRLLEGDVGSGKTVVAAMSAMMVMEQGFQVAMMAPTELLARQHVETLHRFFEPFGYGDRVGLLVGGLKPSQKKAIGKRIADGTVRIMVGTHALIQESLDMHKLGLVIIDEQHRFGVEQRKVLQSKAGHMPHVLHMSATPIPRSLALTLYGELDITIINSKPTKNEAVVTQICSPVSRAQLYEKIDRELDAGRQMFVVCPLITDSEALPLRSAEQVYHELSNGHFKRRRVGFLHGKMKPADKNEVMSKFASGELDVLVSTTVVEVGVDVPNATVMLIESAERFGLAQIHQLRGRVGRGEHRGHCYLMVSDAKQPTRRLRAAASSSDGFKLAELDLELRGPGAIYGTLQHGQLDIKVANLADVGLLVRAKSAAQEFIDSGENLLQYKQLSDRVNALRSVTNLN